MKSKQSIFLLLLAILVQVVISLEYFLNLPWLISCPLWLISAIIFYVLAKKMMAFDILNFHSKPTKKAFCFAALLIIVTTIFSTIAWHGFKPYIEFMANLRDYGYSGAVGQFVYYLIELIMMYLIMGFSQRALEQLTRKKNIPWGGFVLYLTWGLFHIVTKGLLNGLLAALPAILYGIVYLLLKKNPRYALPALYLMFVL